MEDTIRPEYGLTVPEILKAVSKITTPHSIYKTIKDKKIETSVKGKRQKVLPSSSTRFFFTQRGYVYPRLNVSFHIIKGGVGKTSLAYATAVRANMYGARVLCIDFDQQANLTRSFGINSRNKPVWIHILKDKLDVSSTIVPITNTLHLIPSSMNNSRLDIELSSSAISYKDHIRDVLMPIRDNYDLVIFDCPPSLNKITATVACSSDLILMPINADDYSMDALDRTIEEIKSLEKQFKITIDYRVLWNKYDQREKIALQFLHEVAQKQETKDKVFPVVVRTDTTIKNAIQQGLSIFDLKSKANICEDIDMLTRELIGLLEWDSVEVNKH